jgi:hypothetical protein
LKYINDHYLDPVFTTIMGHVLTRQITPLMLSFGDMFADEAGLQTMKIRTALLPVAD